MIEYRRFLQEKINETNDKILKAIQDFENETGLRVDNIDLISGIRPGETRKTHLAKISCVFEEEL